MACLHNDAWKQRSAALAEKKCTRYRARRFITQFPALVHLRGATERAQISNVSAGGLALTGVFMTTKGETIRVQTSGYEIRGCVVWRRGDRIGIAASHPINTEALLTLRRSLNQASTAKGSGRRAIHREL